MAVNGVDIRREQRLFHAKDLVAQRPRRADLAGMRGHAHIERRAAGRRAAHVS
jgi:hypothetical protein